MFTRLPYEMSFCVAIVSKSLNQNSGADLKRGGALVCR
jgi:hypothetical protein